jgi:hypothetical protein
MLSGPDLPAALRRGSGRELQRPLWVHLLRLLEHVCTQRVVPCCIGALSTACKLLFKLPGKRCL